MGDNAVIVLIISSQTLTGFGSRHHREINLKKAETKALKCSSAFPSYYDIVVKMTLWADS